MPNTACPRCGKNAVCYFHSTDTSDIYTLKCAECGFEDERSENVGSASDPIFGGLSTWKATTCPFCGKQEEDHCVLLDMENVVAKEENGTDASPRREMGGEIKDSLEELDDKPKAEVFRSRTQCPFCGAELARLDGGYGYYCPEGCLI